MPLGSVLSSSFLLGPSSRLEVPPHLQCYWQISVNVLFWEALADATMIN